MTSTASLGSLSCLELQLLEEALTQEIIRQDRSNLPGDMKQNRLRLQLKCKLFALRLKKQSSLRTRPAQSGPFMESFQS